MEGKVGMIRDGLFAVKRGHVWHGIGDLGDDAQFAEWLMDDIQYDSDELVVVVDRISQFLSGCGSEIWEGTGNAWHAVIDEHGVAVQNMYSDRIGLRKLTHSDALAVVLQYWQCLVGLGGAAQLEGAVDMFANSNGRAPQIPWPVFG
ncbi:hypothetical protein [Nocardia tengchongensis]